MTSPPRLIEQFEGRATGRQNSSEYRPRIEAQKRIEERGPIGKSDFNLNGYLDFMRSLGISSRTLAGFVGEVTLAEGQSLVGGSVSFRREGETEWHPIGTVTSFGFEPKSANSTKTPPE